MIVPIAFPAPPFSAPGRSCYLMITVFRYHCKEVIRAGEYFYNFSKLCGTGPLILRHTG